MTEKTNPKALGSTDGLAMTIEAQYEHAELVQLAVELRDLLFDDANGIMQGGMIGSPVDCIAFAKWWIQREKGLKPDQDFFEVDNASGEPGHD